LPTIFSGTFVVVAAGVLAATVIDLRTRRIPNGLTAAMTGVGIAMAATGVSDISVAGSFLGFALGLLLMMPGYGLGATGAGDVKLMAAVGAIVGPAVVVTAFFCTAIAGGVLAVIVALQRRRLTATLTGTGRLIGSGGRQQIQTATASSKFAYGPAIAVGSVIAMLIE
jgi:prepilin peptidase CpaA